MRIRELGEINLIRQLTAPLTAGHAIVEDIGDDAAALRWREGKLLLFTCDMLLEDVHFTLRTISAFQIGWKALAVNVSDIAAMGGLPRYAVVSLGIKACCTVRFVKELYKGIRSLAKMLDVRIVGGDTNTSKKLVIDIALIGEVAKKRMVTRRGARVGDVILVTGAIGGAKVRHACFTPRVKEARWLTRHFSVHSMIDISDGLLLDAARMMRKSGVGARLYENLIPVSQYAGSFQEAVTAGEDYELLFTMPPEEAARLFKRYPPRSFSTPIRIIGQVVKKGKRCTMVGKDGRIRPVTVKGYTHFR